MWDVEVLDFVPATSVFEKARELRRRIGTDMRSIMIARRLPAD